jgi:hypothetical protein
MIAFPPEWPPFQIWLKLQYFLSEFDFLFRILVLTLLIVDLQEVSSPLSIIVPRTDLGLRLQPR